MSASYWWGEKRRSWSNNTSAGEREKPRLIAPWRWVTRIHCHTIVLRFIVSWHMRAAKTIMLSHTWRTSEKAELASGNRITQFKNTLWRNIADVYLKFGDNEKDELTSVPAARKRETIRRECLSNLSFINERDDARSSLSLCLSRARRSKTKATMIGKEK